MKQLTTLSHTERGRFRDIINKRDKTNDEQFLCELMNWYLTPDQLRYLYEDTANPATEIAAQSLSFPRR